jgi:hypothetical protein
MGIVDNESFFFFIKSLHKYMVTFFDTPEDPAFLVPGGKDADSKINFCHMK